MTPATPVWNRFELGQRTRIAGILNITPDSFSDGGLFFNPKAALDHARLLIDEGADLIDIGAESTRPGAQPISEDEEWRRLEPLLEALPASWLERVSIDTSKASVIRKAALKGVCCLNDINGLLGDPDMAEVVAENRLAVIAMHNGRLFPIQGSTLDSISACFDKTLDAAFRAGIPTGQLMLDPGIGFGKTLLQNIEILKHLRVFRDRFGLPMLIGTSRKSFIGTLLQLEAHERLEGTLATTVAAIEQGVDFVRVHDVRPNLRAAKMADALYRQNIFT